MGKSLPRLPLPRGNRRPTLPHGDAEDLWSLQALQNRPHSPPELVQGKTAPPQ